MRQAAHSITADDAPVNPITAEIISYALNSIPNQIDTNITRTAYSPLIYEYKDYAVGLVDAEGRLISQCKGGIPIFTANTLGVAIVDGLELHGRDGIRAGDVLISNHSGTLGQHLNNVVMYTPIFAGPKDDDLFGFMAVNVHWMDIGGSTVGSCLSNTSTDIFQEGIQFRSVKLWSAGEAVTDMYRMIEVNTRMPKMVLGDLEAQLAGCLMGRDMVLEVIRKYGLDVTRKSVARMWESSERAARSAVSRFPKGAYKASAFLDNDGINADQTIPVVVEVRVDGDEMTVDFSGVGAQVMGPLNSGINGGAVTAARVAFRYLVLPDEQGNHGTYRPLKVVIPDGTFLSAAADAPKGSYSAALPTVIDTVVKAMAQAMPEKGAGGHHGTFNVHVFYGRHPASHEVFHSLETGHGGWGATAAQDGQGPFKTMVHGDTLDVPVEVQEAIYPLRIDKLGLRRDSGGPGKYRGGLGVEKEYTVLAPCRLTVAIERTKCAPWGMGGGEAGQSTRAYVQSKGKPRRKILKDDVALVRGDRVVLATGGGGGYGPANKRDVERVADDVRHGYISARAARDAYGVVVSAGGVVDRKATEKRRRTMATKTPIPIR
ncbi:MAG: hydantoinase B/oxoprolinase family protein [Alphaproteobacteria bacterium]